MIMSNTSIDTLNMNVGTLWVTVGPFVANVFTMAELLTRTCNRQHICVCL